MNMLNEKFMDSHQEVEVRKGIMYPVPKTLFPSYRLYRFASSANRDLWFASPWWLMLSPFDALKNYAKLRDQSLTLTAGQCLAVDPGRNKLDILVEATVKGGLSAWAGTPKTQSIENDKMHVRRMRPDKDITQLYIPGLGEPDPTDSSRRIWHSAFLNTRHTPIVNL